MSDYRQELLDELADRFGADARRKFEKGGALHQEFMEMMRLGDYLHIPPDQMVMINDEALSNVLGALPIDEQNAKNDVSRQFNHAAKEIKTGSNQEAKTEAERYQNPELSDLDRSSLRPEEVGKVGSRADNAIDTPAEVAEEAKKKAADLDDDAPAPPTPFSTTPRPGGM